MEILVNLLAVFFALNMGGASFAASFGAAYGGKLISRKSAGFLFLLFVILGSLSLGKPVSFTLGNELIPHNLLVERAIIIIFLSGGISMFVANVANIPQSTSLVTVASIAGVGAYSWQVNVKTLLHMLPFWLVLPVVCFGLTYWIAKHFYPRRPTNEWYYERYLNHKDKVKVFVIASCCYNAFSVGTNNVANVVGPLTGTSTLSLTVLLFIFALFYGGGAFVFAGPLRTVGKSIVDLGLGTVAIISVTSGTLMIIASSLGIPQSFVMLQVGAVFAIASIKNGKTKTFQNPITQKTLYTWTINPVITFFVAWGLAWILLR